ncbi:MAG: holo-[acyl-carrier protein] synthase [Candidatus Tokpelaia sp. JSC085]|nr:MAG: holo-[acyl-carrier protein] synthase [Candidatus Tokpelaia sp. JSC085]
MIIGIGNDIMNIQRIGKVLDLYGTRFINRIFTEVEQSQSEARKDSIASYAKRFTAKEACAKALGTGISVGIWWRELEVINLSTGKPTMKLRGRALFCLEELRPKNHHVIIHLTITDDYPWAQALIIIEALRH